MSTQPKVRQFAGDFRMWRKAADGTLTPVIPDASDTHKNQPIETNSLTFGYTEGDETIIASKRRAARYNQPIYDKKLPGTTQLTIALLETPTPILARMLFGEAANADITTGSVTDASLTVTRLDAPIRLPHRFIKASPAPTVETAGSVALVAGTDYTLDLRTGTISILSAGTVGATVNVDDVLTVNYSYEAVTGTTIVGGATPTEAFFITGDLEDRNSSEQGYLEVGEVSLSVDGDIDWLSAEPIQPTLKGTAIVAAGFTEPYTFEVYKQA